MPNPILKLANGRFSRRFVIFGVADLLSKATLLGLTPLLTRYLSPVEYGGFFLLSAAWTWLGMACFGGLDFAYPFFMARSASRSERESLKGASSMGAMVITLILWSMICGIEALTGCLSRLSGLSAAMVGLFLCGALPLSLLTWNLYILRFDGRAMGFAAASLVGRTLGFVVAVGLMFLLGGSHALFLLLASLFGCYLAAWLFSTCFLVRKGAAFHAWQDDSWPLLRRMLGYGARLLPASILYGLCAVVDRFLVGWLLDGQALANLTLAVSLGGMIGMIRSWFGLVWDPYLIDLIARVDARELKARLTWVGQGVGIAMGGVVVLAGLIAEPIVGCLFPPAYRGVAPLLPWIGLAYYFAALSLIAVATVMIANNPRFNALVYGLGLLFNTLVGLLLIPRLGIMGAVLGTVAAEIFIWLGWVCLGCLKWRNLMLNWTPVIGYGALTTMATLGLSWWPPSTSATVRFGLASMVALGLLCAGWRWYRRAPATTV